MIMAMIWRNIFLTFGVLALLIGAVLGLAGSGEFMIGTSLAGIGFMIGAVAMAITGQHK
ncbi:hypothetical protein GCM10014719_38770 [Planomonospora parontospora subsp. antibiotica]|nr:hypothetical protein GCM10014719_38770 [Planomonospora parontospora subsp. antibiotica]